eukprot:jgi/Orpsp1_1/1185586/evm.model.c7180000094482.1
MNVISKGKGIKVKESVSIKEAEISIDSGDTGIKVTMDTDPEKGFVVIDGGKITIKANNDGIHAETHLSIHDGFINVIESGEALEGQMIDITGGEININASNDGINASKIGPHEEEVLPVLMDEEGNIIMAFPIPPKKGGKSKRTLPETEGFTNATDDDDDDEHKAERIEDDVTVDDDEDSPSETETETETENVNDDDDLKKKITTEMQIKQAKYQTQTEINEPKNNITISDLFSQAFRNYNNDEQVYVRITGGKIHIKNDGDDSDGIDSNGSLYIGGDAEVYVDYAAGTLFGFMATLDASGTGIINNNSTVLLTGSLEKPMPPPLPDFSSITAEDVYEVYPDFTEKQLSQYMELMKELLSSGQENLIEPPSDSDNIIFKQPYVKVVFDEIKKVNTSIIVKDNKGEVLIDHKPKADFVIMLFTSPKINEGETYTIIAGDETVTAVAQVDNDKEIPN